MISLSLLTRMTIRITHLLRLKRPLWNFVKLAASLGLGAVGCGDWEMAAAQSKTATTTTLTVTSGGRSLTTVSAGSVVALTATVTSGGTAVTAGQVNFCDATAPHCTDVHLLGTAQLTKSGTATFKLRPKAGNNSYQAVFAGTANAETSASSPAALAVTGKSVTSTILAQSANSGNYTFTAEVGGDTATAPTGTVTFLDATDKSTVLSTSTLASATAGLTFISLSNPDVTTPFQVAMADFNGDGILDLAVLNADLSTVTVLLGNGDGRFTATPAPDSQDNFAIAITTGDFNGDGNADLAIVNSETNTISVLLGNGNGTFTPTTAINTAVSACGGGICPNTIVAADFNRDGILDLVTSAGVVLLGNGDGTFTAAPSLQVTGSSSIAVGDFDGDGNLDLAMSSGDVFLGNGDGTFRAGTALPVAGPIAAGDFNGDGKIDLAVANTPTVQGNSPPFIVVPTNMITILSGNGDGTFSVHTTGPLTSNFPSAIAVGDFNADGIADLAVVDYAYMVGFPGGVPDPAEISILLGDGKGNFTFAISPLNENFMFEGVNPPAALAVGDFNGDGIADLAQPFWSGFETYVGYPEYVPDAVNVLLSGQSSATATVAGINVPLSDTVIANYAGDNANLPSSSATTNLNLPPTLTGDALSTVSPGASSSATLTLAAGPTYSGTMKLTCALTSSPSGAQSVPICFLNPASLTLAAGGTGTSMFTAKTTAATNGTAMLRLSEKFGNVVLAALLMMGLARRRRQIFATLALLLIFISAVATGCGGGSSGTHATTAGTYTFTVTATDSANSSITTTTKLIVTVQ